MSNDAQQEEEAKSPVYWTELWTLLREKLSTSESARKELVEALENIRREIQSSATFQEKVIYDLADAALSAHPATPPISRVDGL